MIPHFLEEGPAFLAEGERRILVVADTHFGAESGLSRRGVHIPSTSSERFMRILSCIDASEPDFLVLLGDIKHSVPGTSWQEAHELPRIFSELRSRVPFIVVPGNHDPGIGRYLKSGELSPNTGVVIDGIGYLHGHTRPSPDLMGRLLICGHYHPVVSIYDEVGCALRARPAYILAGLDLSCRGVAGDDSAVQTRVLMMPAFNEYAGGMDVRAIPGSGLGPLSRCLKTEEAEVFLGDGTYIDRLDALIGRENS